MIPIIAEAKRMSIGDCIENTQASVYKVSLYLISLYWKLQQVFFGVELRKPNVKEERSMFNLNFV